MNEKVLIVEDDEDIREGVRLLLEGEDFRVCTASEGSDALKEFSEDIQLVILDVMMPGLSGFDVCRELRKISNVPILFLTAKDQETDKLRGLSAGGDDYLTKPFSYVELLARVRALLRRFNVYKGANTEKGTSSNWLERSGIKLNLKANEVYLEGTLLNLTDMEYGVLRLLMEYPGQIFSAESIYESVWNEPFLYQMSGNTVMVHIRRLRKKIETDSENPRLIQTVWGKGYRFYEA